MQLLKGPNKFEMGKNMHPLYTFGFKIADTKKQLEMDKVAKTANILLSKPQKRIKVSLNFYLFIFKKAFSFFFVFFSY